MSKFMTVLLCGSLEENKNLPKVEVDPLDSPIFKMSPSAWADPNYGVTESAGRVSSMADKSGNFTWSNASSPSPVLGKSSDGTKFIRFNIATDTPTGGRALTSGVPVFPENGAYTMFIISRVFEKGTNGFTGTGGNMAGNFGVLANGEALRIRLAQDSYDGNNVWLNQGGTSVSLGHYKINSSYPFRDGKFNIHEIRALETGYSWFINGNLLQENKVPLVGFGAGNPQILILGAACNPISHIFCGDIGTLLMFNRSLSQTERAAVYDKLNSLVSKLSA